MNNGPGLAGRSTGSCRVQSGWVGTRFCRPISTATSRKCAQNECTYVHTSMSAVRREVPAESDSIHPAVVPLNESVLQSARHDRNARHTRRTGGTPPTEPHQRDQTRRRTHARTLLVQVRMQGARPLVAQDVREVAGGLGHAQGVLLLPVVGQGPGERQPPDLADRHSLQAGAEADVVVVVLACS